MRKLTSEQIIELKKLKEQGESLKNLMERFKISLGTIYYHTSENYRNVVKEYRQRYRKGNKKYYESQKEYQKTYHKNRYNNDEEFRKKHLNFVKN